MVLLVREIHGFYNMKTLGPWLAEAWKALKPGGVLGVVQHRAPAGANPADTAKNGYVDQGWVIAQIEAAGFKLAGKSEVNANPKDTKDYPEGVWSLPPTYREKDTNRAKYARHRRERPHDAEVREGRDAEEEVRRRETARDDRAGSHDRPPGSRSRGGVRHADRARCAGRLAGERARDASSDGAPGTVDCRAPPWILFDLSNE